MLVRAFLIAFAAIALSSCDRPNNSDPAEREALREWRVDPEKVDPGALRSAANGGELQRFYQRVQWRAVWNDERAAQLIEALQGADRHALDHVAFLPAQAPDAPVAREVALTRAALAYADALANGRVNPKRLWRIYTVPAPRTDVTAGLAAALAGQEPLGQWLESLAPQTEEYRALSDAYLHYRRQAAAATEPSIGRGEAIKPGDSDARVPALVEALQTNGYLGEVPEQAHNPTRYHPVIAAAVARLQSDYGIDADGIVGPDTLQVLNTGASDRARQLAVALERRRWLDRSPAGTRIDVNTAAAFLDYWRGGSHRDRRRVVVGQPDWETPQLGSPIFRLVANPTWTVPDSIYEEEIAGRGAGYLARNNMVWKNGRVVQLPGPENSLGLVKFDMLNDHAIYLHDTPAKPLFAENERHRSHGCVRVHEAVQFARQVAYDDGILDQFDEELVLGEEEFVDLRQDLPVRLLYHTAFTEGGQVRFRTDAYGWDEVVAVALGLTQRARRTLRPREHDVGP